MNRAEFFGYLRARRRARVLTLPVFQPTRATLERLRLRSFLRVHETLSRQVFDARHRVSQSRSEGWLCPECDAPIVLERHGDTLDASGRRGVFKLWHEAPMCEMFSRFSYTFVQAAERKGGSSHGRSMRLATGELGASGFKTVKR